MSEFKGTPGPWEVVDDHPQRSVLYIYSCDGDTHACVYTVDEYADRNANLIAAAPELLEALQNLKRELVLSDVPLDYIESHFRPHIDRARAAISKALGQ